MTFLVAAEGLVMYFLTDGYASFWGYGPLDPISSFATIGEGYSLVMLATFWACLLRKTDVWKAYGRRVDSVLPRHGRCYFHP